MNKEHLSGRVFCVDQHSHVFVTYLVAVTNTTNKEIFVHDFVIILKHLLQNYCKIMNTYFLATTCIVMPLAG